jgi:putative SOS response-associated peptidase YedK
MCGRFVVALPTGELFETFSVVGPYMPVPRFNIAPTTGIPVVKLAEEGREIVEMRWGLIPSWAKPDAKLPLMINARAETVHTGGAFRSAFKSRRCIVPASGYYEWRASSFTPRTNAQKQPFYFRRRDGKPIAFAAVWEAGRLKDQVIPTVATITTDPNADAALVHDRMPVMLEREDFDRWLDPAPLTDEERAKFLAPRPVGELEIYAVDKRVGSIRNDDPHLIEPIAKDTLL